MSQRDKSTCRHCCEGVHVVELGCSANCAASLDGRHTPSAACGSLHISGCCVWPVKTAGGGWAHRAALLLPRSPHCELAPALHVLVPEPSMKGQQEKRVSCFIFGRQETKVICQAHYEASANLSSASIPWAKVTQPRPKPGTRKHTPRSMRPGEGGCRILLPILQSASRAFSGILGVRSSDFQAVNWQLASFTRTQEFKIEDNGENQVFNWGTCCGT